MAFPKPFYRNVRRMIPDSQGRSRGSWYISDPEYALDPAHYTRAASLIVEDLKKIFDFVEPSDEGEKTFSYRIHALLMRTCIEIEANFQAIFQAHSFKPRERLNIREYRRIDVTHHLSSYEVKLPMWNGSPRTWKPFEPWHPYRGKTAPKNIRFLEWYQAYNASKHNRQNEFRTANLGVLIEAVAALIVVISSQFESVSSGVQTGFLTMVTGQWKPSIGQLFEVKYPNDWLDEEAYDFDWSELEQGADRFAKLDYEEIPV